MLPLGHCGLRCCRGGFCGLTLSAFNPRLVSRHYSSQPKAVDHDGASNTKKKELLGFWKKYHDPISLMPSTSSTPTTKSDTTLTGFLGKQRNFGKHLCFADLKTSSGEVVQICCSLDDDRLDLRSRFRRIRAHTPVLIRAQSEPPNALAKTAPKEASAKRTLYLEDIQELNIVSKDLIVTADVRFPQTRRHLQIRFHRELHARLTFRSWLKGQLSQRLLEKGFIDVETPTLFKSTSEGAREFVVPTRQVGTAYALSQSPQQYKQVLMASGITRYMQWARCYRDEDLRADRQPEFTQLDMEWAFAGPAQVQEDVNDVIIAALSRLRPSESYEDIGGERIPIVSNITADHALEHAEAAHVFTSLTFADSIAAYGSDKPDLRIPNRVHAIEDIEPYKDFVNMITHLSDPLIEAFVLPLKEAPLADVRKFVIDFMDNLPPALANNPDGRPQILVLDSTQPLSGFSSLGFEYQNILDKLSDGKALNDGDLVVFQAREKPKGQYCLGSTKIGDMRTTLWKGLVEKGLMEKPRLGDANSLQFVWITEFPMFKPVEEGEPGQGAAAGIAAAHHPFTAPLSSKDLEALFTDPLQARSAAYDLVLNGVEVGGGSQRIHVAAIQDFVMRDVLKMPDASIKEFAHLFDALGTRCPPHAGFALGFDRLTALLTDTATVRDVIAFPKTMKGEDAFVRSPSKLTDEQLAPYGLQLRRQSN